ncbi:MAG: S1 RNA-binding domain-containing protein, partial [Chloroflexota bacterium]|nr:S1 RNA-binding domain-containing protein [Chloroflexota bacterium]
MTQDTNEASRPTEDTEPSASATSNEEPTTPGQTEGVEATDDAAMAQSDTSDQPDEIEASTEEHAEPTADGATPAEGVTDAQGTATAGAEVTAGPAAAEPATAAEPEAVPPTTEAMTMAELLDHPDHAVKSLKHGDVVEGTVVRIDPDEILVDFGGKSEGVVSNRELMNRRGPRDGDERSAELSVGDEVLVYVLQPESPEGHAVLSLRRAGLERKWRAMQERFDAGEIVEARVIDHNKGGLIVDLGVRGFVPISQIVDFPRRPRDEQPRDAAQEIAEKLQPFVGRTLRLKILEVNRKANRLILSEKVALYEERREKRDELFSSLETGQKVTGIVRSIAPFGVFVDLGGIDGLVHKSELSWNKVNNPETAHQIGEEVEAEVIDINHERGRISLSIRRL